MISVFTPSHDTTYLDDCYRSLKAQSHTDWEWVVLLNQGAKWTPPKDDSRVTVAKGKGIKGVGALKQRAVELTSGDILVELDHDDLLAPDALAQIDVRFNDSDAGLVYSHFAHIDNEGDPVQNRFDPTFGWEYEQVKIDGTPYEQCRAMQPSPHNVSYVWYAPNHVRAFKRSVYDQVGGYDPRREILDDHELMCRLFQAAPFQLIDECLYLQRVHQGNTQKDQLTNQRIQVDTVAIYDQHIQANALQWAQRNKLAAVDLGSAHNKPEGYLGLDRVAGEGIDIVWDANEGLPFDDSEVGVIRAVDFLEHIPDKVKLFNELYRVLAPGGLLLSMTPSTDGRGAFQDPTHVSFYNENAFWYFTNATYRSYVPEIQCRFQISRLGTGFPSQWHQQNWISYVTANLIAVKEGLPRQGGPLLI